MLPIEMGIYYSKMLYKCYNMEYTSITIKKEVM